MNEIESIIECFYTLISSSQNQIIVLITHQISFPFSYFVTAQVNLISTSQDFVLYSEQGRLVPFSFGVEDWHLASSDENCLSYLPWKAVSSPGSHFGSILPIPALVYRVLVLHYEWIFALLSVAGHVLRSPGEQISRALSNIKALTPLWTHSLQCITNPDI